MTLENGKRVMKRGVYVERFLSSAKEGNRCDKTTDLKSGTAVQCILDKEHPDKSVPHYVNWNQLEDGQVQLFWGDEEYFEYLFRAQGKSYSEIKSRQMENE